MNRIFRFVLLFVLAAFPAAAELHIVATTSSMGMLARTVGGDAVKVVVLASPDRDAHYLLAKPSMMVALRRADLLITVGADLEIGWLPAALQGCNNSKILPGHTGYFEGAAQIELIEKGQAPDRSGGDVHPAGNPHFYMDPERMVQVARALAGRLGEMDPATGTRFKANAETFAQAVAERLPGWKEKAAGAPGVVLYHKDANYLTGLLGVPVLGYVEPLPGIPPTAAHLKDLVQRLGGRKGVILYNNFQSGQGPDFLVVNLNWKKHQLPLEVGLEDDSRAYLTLIDRWVTAVASGKL